MIEKTALILCIFALSSCSGVNKQLGLKDDNISEEILEEVIESKTGLDLDLTPETPEKESSSDHLLEKIEDYFLEPESTQQEKTHTRYIDIERLPTIHLCT